MRRFALERYFYPTPAAAVASAAALDSLLDRLDATRAQFARSGQLLERALALDDSIRSTRTRLTYYYHLRASTDTRDGASARAEDSIDFAVETRASWLGVELAALAPALVEKMLAAQPSLRKFRYAIERAQADGRRPQGPAESALLGRLSPFATGWQFRIWQQLPPEARDARATVLVETIRARNALARERGFPSAPDEVYASRGLQVDSVKALYRRVRAASALYQRYLALRTGPRAAAAPFRAPFDSVLPWATRALRPLGAPYERELRSLFDPAAERLDIGDGANRRRGGFSFIAPAVTTGVYLDSYGGALRDMSRLVHESAHALHRALMDRAGVPQAYRYAPLLLEPIALFNELVLADDLYRHATTPSDRRQALEQFLNKALEVFHGAQDAELEQAFYDGVAAGAVDNANGLDSLTRAVDEAYLSLRAVNDGRRWMRTRLLVEDPLYLSNYLYSGLFALALYSAFEADTNSFGPRYVRFLQGGFDRPPFDVVRRQLGIELSTPSLLERGMQLLELRVAEYEALTPDS